MKKIISLVLAFMLVVCLSVPAFAVDVDTADGFLGSDTFSVSTKIDISGIVLSSEQIEYLKKWVTSDNSVLFCFRKNGVYILTFLNVSLSSSFSFQDIFLYNSDFCDFLVIDLISSYVRFFSHFPSAQAVSGETNGIPFFVSGSYFANTGVELSPTIKSLINYDKFSISDDYGIFDGWESSYDPPAVRYGVSVDYKYPDGTEAAPPVSGNYHVGDTYNIASPAIDGYAPDIAAVSGTITETSELTTEYHVTYRDMSRMVNVDYKYPDGAEAAPPVSGKYFVGNTYNIPSPDIDGYAPDIPTVSGSVLETSDPVTDYHVVYIETPCKLTVNYSFEDGTEAAPPFIGQYGKGERYSINSPRLAGYLANYPVVRGTFPTADTSDIVFDVVYRVDRSIITSGDFEPFTKGILETVAVIFMVCCSLYTVILSVKCVIELLRSMTR